jgi:hypothetical protein
MSLLTLLRSAPPPPPPPPPSPAYTIQLRAPDGSILREDARFASARATWTLDGHGAIEVSLTPNTDDEAWAPNTRIRLLRDDALIWSGILTRLEVGGRGASTETQVAGLGIASLAVWRLIHADLVFTDQPAQDVAWQLVRHVQDQPDGDLGIVRGPHSGPTRTVSRVYCDAGTTLAEALDQIHPELDWDVDHAGRFVTWTPVRGQARTLVLGTAGTADWSIERDIEGPLSYVTGVPGDQDGCAPYPVIVSDPAAVAEMGRREAAVDTDTTDTTEMVSWATSELKARSRAALGARLAWWEHDLPFTPPDDLWLGDTVRLVASDGPLTVDRICRIKQISVTLEPGAPAFWEYELEGT